MDFCLLPYHSTEALARAALIAPFMVAIEALALRFRQSPLVKGISLGERTDVTGLYADNLILYLQNASLALQTAMRIIDTFGDISGLKNQLAKVRTDVSSSSGI